MTFLRDIWYVAGHDFEIDEKPLGRTYLGEPVVIYKTESGELVGLDDRCPHRFAPLHQGKVTGESIECPYHGLKFDKTGGCPHSPVGGKIPPRAKLRTYPIEARHGLLFIWMGEPEKADADLIPDFSYLYDPSIDWFNFTLHAKANYQLVVDNLLDLTHAEFLHPLLTSDGWTQRTKMTVKQNGNTINILNVAKEDNILPIMKLLRPDLNDVGTTTHYENWHAPSLIHLDVHYQTDNGKINFPSAHMLTPETATTTHFFVVGGQTIDPSNPEISAQIKGGTQHAFGLEDIPILEAQQKVRLLELAGIWPN